MAIPRVLGVAVQLRGILRRVLSEGQTPKAVATAFGVTTRTVRKWVGRFRAEGVAGLADRSSRPHRLRKPTPDEIARRIEVLRRRDADARSGGQARPGPGPSIGSGLDV